VTISYFIIFGFLENNNTFKVSSRYHCGIIFCCLVIPVRPLKKHKSIFIVKFSCCFSGRIEFSLFSWYIFLMTITQTVEIPDNRRVHLDFEVPREVPTGRTSIILQFPVEKQEEKNKEVIPFLALRGTCKDNDTLDAYFARKQADKDFENGLTDVNPYLKRQ